MHVNRWPGYFDARYRLWSSLIRLLFVRLPISLDDHPPACGFLRCYVCSLIAFDTDVSRDPLKVDDYLETSKLLNLLYYVSNGGQARPF